MGHAEGWELREAVNRTAKVIANVKVNGQRFTHNIEVDYESYREESLNRWAAHVNTLPEDQRDQDPPEITHEHFDRAVHQIAFQVSQEPMMVTSGECGQETLLVVGQPDYVEVVFGASSSLVVPKGTLLS